MFHSRFLSVVIGVGVANQYQKRKMMATMGLDKAASALEYSAFVEGLSPDYRKMLRLALVKTNKESERKEIEAKEDIPSEEILREAKWVSSHWIKYVVSKNAPFDYHKVLVQVAAELGVAKGDIVDQLTTFQLEHLVFTKIFTVAWDRLSKEKREEILKESAKLDMKTVAGIAAMSGGAVASAILAMEVMAGHWFYFTFCSHVIVAAASAITGASAATTIATVSALCGPVGWCVACASLVGGGLLVGGADVQRSAAFIIQNHLIKLDLMRRADIDPQQYLRGIIK